jgi:hypothetical protein
VALYVIPDVAALPVGAEYRVIADRADLFGGVVVETDSKLDFPAAPKCYPNGVPLLDGAGDEDGHWQTVAAPIDPAAHLDDEALLKAVEMRGLVSAELIADLRAAKVAPEVIGKVVGRG